MMRRCLVLGAAVALWVSAAGDASAFVQFGAPDFSNYLSRPKVVSCDWQYPNYFRACPTPHPPPKPVDAPTKKKS